MPRGRSPPPGFGIVTRRTGAGHTSSRRVPPAGSPAMPPNPARRSARRSPRRPPARPHWRGRARRHERGYPRDRPCRRAGIPRLIEWAKKGVASGGSRPGRRRFSERADARRRDESRELERGGGPRSGDAESRKSLISIRKLQTALLGAAQIGRDSAANPPKSPAPNHFAHCARTGAATPGEPREGCKSRRNLLKRLKTAAEMAPVNVRSAARRAAPG